MSKKLILVFIIIIATIIGLWSWTLVVPSDSISIGGSASVQPLLKKFTNNYKTEDDQNFVYSATGSGAGITNVQSEVYEIGFISKKVSSKDWEANNEPVNENDSLLKNAPEWSESNKDWYYDELIKDDSGINEDTYRAVELAKDSFVFVYNDKDTGFEEFLEASGLSFTFNLNDDNKIHADSAEILHNIYEHDSQNDLWTWQHLAEFLASKSTENQDRNLELAKKVSKKPITPYSSTSGSGTRSSFSDLTLYDENNIERSLTPGQAVKEYNSNGAIYGQIIQSPGSIGFVSMLYAENLTEDVKAVKIQKDETIWDLNAEKESIPANYPLTRPFISILKIRKDDPNFHDAANFIYWMAASDEAGSYYEELGLQQSVKTQN